MADACYTPLRGKVLRVVRLDACGSAVTGATSQVVTDGFIKVDFAPEYEDGEEFILKNANGDLAVNEKDPDRLKRIGLTITLCSIDPSAIELMLGMPLITDAGDSIGNFYTEGVNHTKFGLEVWADLAGQACVDGLPTYEHLAIGWVENARIGNSTTEYGPAQFEITGSTHRNPNYGTGPFDLLPQDLPDTGHMARYKTNVAPPASVCGYQALAA